jgi:hypothetical protein
MVAARIDLAAKARLTRLLWLDPTSGRSEFDRLKTPAKAATLGKFKLRLAHLQALDELGATEQWLDGIPATKIAHFAGEARVTDVGDMRDIGEAKRWTLLASLIHECLICLRRTRCRSPRWIWCRARCSPATSPRPRHRPPPRRAGRGHASLRRRVPDGHHPLVSFPIELCGSVLR